MARTARARRWGQPARFFEPALARAIAADQADADRRGDLSKMDADPFCDCQDFEGMSSVAITGVSVDRKRPRAVARARASFAFGDTQLRIDYVLVWTRAGWRIDDLTWSEGGSLRAIYFPPPE